MRKLLIPIALTAATLASVPAAAQVSHYRWDNPRGAHGYFQREINQLDRQIQRSLDHRAISRREAIGLRREASQLQWQFNRARRDGIDRRESAMLDQRLYSIHSRLRMERWDRDGRRG
jgi:hypothetical protein